MNRKLTISLVTWNGARYLDQCLDSLTKQTFQDFDILALDNGSSDGSAMAVERYADKFAGRFELIKNSANIGFAKGHNLAMARNTSPYIMLLNQDIMLEPEYLEKCVGFLDENAKAGAVSGKILKWNFPQPGQPSDGLNKSEKSNTIDSLGLQIFRSQRVIERAVGQADKPEYFLPEEVFGVSGTVPIYRQAALESVRFENEYFDEDFFSYKEDVDLSYRLRLAGWQIWVVNAAVAYHDRNASAHENLSLAEKISHRKKKTPFVNYNSFKNQRFLMMKNLSKKNFWRNSPWIIIYELKKYIYAFFYEKPSLKALEEVKLKEELMLRKRKFILDNAKVSDSEISKWFA